MAGRHRGSGRGRVGQGTGRHRKGTRFYAGSTVRKHQSSSNPFSGIFSRLRPSWTPAGGWPQAGPPGVHPGRPDLFAGTLIRFPAATYKSRTHRTNRLFGDWT